MATVNEITAVLDEWMPPRLAEKWDNTGLLVGDRTADVRRVMTCLTLTPDSVGEAVQQEVDLVVSHHPLPFKPLQRLTTDTTEGRLLWQLARNGVAVYSPHTAFDSAAEGINCRLADGLGLTKAKPLTPDVADPTIGTARVAKAPAGDTLDTLAERAKTLLDLPMVRVVGKPNQQITRVGIACGSGGSMLDEAVAAGCDAFVTGESNFHGCLAAEAQNVALLLVGHYASERFAVEALADQLAKRFSALNIHACQAEHDPLRTV